MAKRKNPERDVLDDFRVSNHERALALVLWKIRHQYPELAVPITAEDIRAFVASTEFTKQVPKVVMYRRPGIIAKPGIPAAGRRRAVPPTPGQPAGTAVMVMLVEDGTEVRDPDTGSIWSPGDAIRPVESDEKDHGKATRQRTLKAIKEEARQLASDLIRDAASGMYSDSKIQEAAQALVMLADD